MKNGQELSEYWNQVFLYFYWDLILFKAGIKNYEFVFAIINENNSHWVIMVFYQIYYQN